MKLLKHPPIQQRSKKKWKSALYDKLHFTLFRLQQIAYAKYKFKPRHLLCMPSFWTLYKVSRQILYTFTFFHLLEPAFFIGWIFICCGVYLNLLTWMPSQCLILQHSLSFYFRLQDLFLWTCKWIDTQANTYTWIHA